MGVTIVVLPLMITDTNLDIGTSFMLFFVQKMFKKLKHCRNDAHAFCTILMEKLLVDSAAAIPSLDLRETARGLF